MQRLLALRQQAVQRRPPSHHHLPTGFFTASPVTRTARTHHFSDSSRSRPPSSKNGNGRTGAPATKAGAAARKAANGGATNGSSSSSSSPSSTPAASSDTTVRQGFGRRSSRSNHSTANSVSSSSGNAGTPTFEPVVDDAATSAAESFKLPSSLTPRSILHTPPNQISLDAFYSLGRPLLEVTIPQSYRRSVSETDKKAMAIVGEPENAMSEDMDINGQELEGEYDAHLITEPYGADPAWGEGTEAYLAGIAHGIPPPAPAPVTEAEPQTTNKKTAHSSSSSSSSPPSPPSLTKSTKAAKRQEAIDFLFPFREEQPLISAEGRGPLAQWLMNEMNTQESAMAPKGLSSSSSSGTSSSNGFRRKPSPEEAHRFLTSHQVKNRWSGMWDWEGVSKALDAAEQKYSQKKQQGSEKETTLATTESQRQSSVREPLEKLRQTARSKARARLRAKRAKRQNHLQGGNAFPEFMQLGDFFKGHGPSDGQFMVISMPASTSSSDKSSTFKTDKSSTKAAITQEQVDERKAFNAEVRKVIDQARKFAGFFSKSVTFEKEGVSSQETDAKIDNHNKKNVEVEEGSSEDIKIVHVDLQNVKGSPKKAIERWFREQEGKGWEDVVAESQSRGGEYAERSLDTRMVTGPRIGAVQCGRGRSLNRTLRERLEARGIHLVGQHRTIVLDSVKRKRRKRISKHKYKKRRKATRAERRKAGK